MNRDKVKLCWYLPFEKSTSFIKGRSVKIFNSSGVKLL